MTINGSLTHFVLPDVMALCPYQLRINPHCDEQTKESEKWLFAIAGFTKEREEVFTRGKFGEFTSGCYPDADAPRLRVCIDFMNFAFALDDWMEEFEGEGVNAMAECTMAAIRDPINFKTDKKIGILTKCWFGRLTQTAIHSSVIDRIVQSLMLTYQAQAQEEEDRINGYVPDLQTYIVNRREASGARPFLPLLEYVGGYYLPKVVLEDPVFQSLENAVIDHVGLVNDIFSINKELGAISQTWNLIPVLMKEKGLSLQGAVDVAGDLCNSCFEQIVREQKRLPSWGPDIDGLVAKYIVGLLEWLTSSLHWPFSSERYFGKNGPEVKKQRIVQLHPNLLKELNELTGH